MNIGIVTPWFERGAAYVSRAYADLLKNKNNVYIYARGGEKTGKKDPNWDNSYVTWGYRLPKTNIKKTHFFKWIKKYSLDLVLFNEQYDYYIVAKTKKKFMKLKIGTYVDYYTEKTIPYFNIYDFVICNTKRHFDAMDNHPQRFYVKWGTDIKLFSPKSNKKSQSIVFFHSAGMSTRKGTDLLIKSFIKGELYKNSKLIIHSQINIESFSSLSEIELNNYNITLINKTITAPGLYYKGDIYVYPTRLDGLGLTIYEAIASGLPVITTNNPPMSEVIDSSIGKLIKVNRFISRSDGYYWPQSVVDEDNLILQMKFYINNPGQVLIQSKTARDVAVKKFNWFDREQMVNDIFVNSENRNLDILAYEKILKANSSLFAKIKLAINSSIILYKIYTLTKGR